MTTTINNTTTTNNNVTMNAPASATSAVVNTTINTAAVTPNLKDPDLVDFTLDGEKRSTRLASTTSCLHSASRTQQILNGLRRGFVTFVLKRVMMNLFVRMNTPSR